MKKKTDSSGCVPAARDDLQGRCSPEKHLCIRHPADAGQCRRYDLPCRPPGIRDRLSVFVWDEEGPPLIWPASKTFRCGSGAIRTEEEEREDIRTAELLCEKVKNLAEARSLTEQTLQRIYNAAYSKEDWSRSKSYLLLKAKLPNASKWGDWVPAKEQQEPPAEVNLATYRGFNVEYSEGRMFVDV